MEPNVNANPEPETELETAPEEEPAQNVPEMAFAWEASEFVHHHKSPMWYLVLAASVVLLIGVAIYYHFWVEIALFITMGVAIIVYASKPPRTLAYELSVDGIHIDGRLYPFEAFRSFSVVEDEEWHSIDLEPVKRFSPRVVILYDPEDYDPIIGHLELHLPREDREPDLIEKITRAVRF